MKIQIPHYDTDNVSFYEFIFRTNTCNVTYAVFHATKLKLGLETI